MLETLLRLTDIGWLHSSCESQNRNTSYPDPPVWISNVTLVIQ